MIPAGVAFQWVLADFGSVRKYAEAYPGPWCADTTWQVGVPGSVVATSELIEDMVCTNR